MWDCSEREKIKQAGECTCHKERSRSERSHPVWGSLATFSLFPLQNGLHVTACGRSECERARESKRMGLKMGGGEQQPRSINMSSSNLVLYLSCRILPHTNCTLRALGSSKWVTFSVTWRLVSSGQVFSCCAAQSPWTDCREQDKTWCLKKLGPWYCSSLLTLNVKPSFLPRFFLLLLLLHVFITWGKPGHLCLINATLQLPQLVSGLTARVGGRAGTNGNCVLKRTWVRSSGITVQSERIQQDALIARSAVTTIRLWHTNRPPIKIFWHQQWVQRSWNVRL